MQNYILCEVTCAPELAEILIAEMGDLNYEGFIETDQGFEAYLPEADFDEKTLKEVLEKYELNPDSVNIKKVEQQNWNAEWESNFEPVTIENKLRIRATFHESDSAFPMEIVIQPKTSFGTGHHETTFTIMELMLAMDMKGKSVFDYGSGTGILAILASKLGASHILANDIDSWAAENIFENTELNNVSDLEFIHGDLTQVPQEEFDIILANINKNILMDSFWGLAPLLKKNGVLLISGFYESDLADLKWEAEKQGFSLIRFLTKNNWAAAEFTR